MIDIDTTVDWLEGLVDVEYVVAVQVLESVGQGAKTVLAYGLGTCL